MTTRVRFHDRIASLQRALVAIGHEVQRSIPDATDAWLRRDDVAGRAVDARTAGWSARARDVEVSAYELMATQQPMASDLRRLAALVRLSEEIARSGDLVAHIARSACFERPTEAFTAPQRALIVEMAAVAAHLWGIALDAYARGDADAAGVVAEGDDELDALQHELYETLLAAGVSQPCEVDLALLGRFYERLGDHAVEVAAQARWIATGE